MGHATLVLPAHLTEIGPGKDPTMAGARKHAGLHGVAEIGEEQVSRA